MGTLAISGLYAQQARVGINTTTPKATLEVAGNPTDATKLDGIIAPKMTGAQLRAKSYTADQTGALIYVTAADTAPAGQTIHVTTPGYYYFNGDASMNRWLPINISTQEPWRDAATNQPATSNTQNIYQNGKVAIAKNTIASTDPTFTIGGKGKAFGVDNNATLEAKNTSGVYETWLYPRWTDNGTYFDYGSGGLFLRHHASATSKPLTMTLTPTGNVGIGILTPAAKLEVNGTTRLSNKEWTANQRLVLEFNNGREKSGATAQIIDEMNGNGDGGDNLLFATQSPTPGVNPNLTAPTEKMRITANGNVGIGTRTPAAKLHVVGGEIVNATANGFRWVQGNYGMISRNDGGAFYLLPTASGDAMGGWSASRPFHYSFGTKHLSFMIGAGDGNVGIGTTTPAEKLAVVGNVAVSGFVKTASLDLNSDKRLKTNINTMPDSKSIEQIKQLNPVTYYWNTEGKAKGGNDKLQYGLIAQEVEKVFPEMVSTDKEGYKSVNYIELIPVLLKAVQEQQKEIEVLKKKIK